MNSRCDFVRPSCATLGSQHWSGQRRSGTSAVSVIRKSGDPAPPGRLERAALTTSQIRCTGAKSDSSAKPPDPEYCDAPIATVCRDKYRCGKWPGLDFLRISSVLAVSRRYHGVAVLRPSRRRGGERDSHDDLTSHEHCYTVMLGTGTDLNHSSAGAQGAQLGRRNGSSGVSRG